MHPRKGGRHRYVNCEFLRYIVSLDEAESVAVLGLLVEHAPSPNFALHRRWSVGEVCLWDDRASVSASLLSTSENGETGTHEDGWQRRLVLKGPIANDSREAKGDRQSVHPTSKSGAAAGTGDHDDRRDVRRNLIGGGDCGDVRIEFERRLARGRQNMRAGTRGASSVRGVSDQTINIAVFNDAANTIVPGLEVEFPQQATPSPTGATPPGASTGARS